MSIRRPGYQNCVVYKRGVSSSQSEAATPSTRTIIIFNLFELNPLPLIFNMATYDWDGIANRYSGASSGGDSPEKKWIADFYKAIEASKHFGYEVQNYALNGASGDVKTNLAKVYTEYWENFNSVLKNPADIYLNPAGDGLSPIRVVTGLSNPLQFGSTNDAWNNVWNESSNQSIPQLVTINNNKQHVVSLWGDIGNRWNDLHATWNANQTIADLLH
jgi:hypothetical protein